MNRVWLRAATLTLLVTCADWFFRGYFGGAIDLSLALFLALLAIGIVLCGGLNAPRRELNLAIALVIVGLLPLIDSAGLLAFLLAILALAHLAVVKSGTSASGVPRRLSRSCGIIVAGPFIRFGVLVSSIVRQSRAGTARRVGNAAILWTVPAAFGAVFVFLFASANPVIDNSLAALRFDQLFAALDIGRICFWLVMGAIISPFIFPHRRVALSPSVVAALTPDAVTYPEWISGDGAILRSLAVFNVLFAVETLLDLRYLWSGAALPQGLTFADYAHRGAYPLMATALLAGGFVIVAIKPGSAREHSLLLRALVFAWVAQNVLLVASSILRLKLYVATYSLTYWRCAAFIWMCLVAIGLVWVVVRIVRKQSNRWLVSANLVTLGLTLYACCFVNFASLVASYNVAHSREMGGPGQPLDLCYLVSLGPEAIPAIDRYIARADVISGALLLDRKKLADENQAALADWRGWNLQGSRLAYYLRHHL